MVVLDVVALIVLFASLISLLFTVMFASERQYKIAIMWFLVFLSAIAVPVSWHFLSVKVEELYVAEVRTFNTPNKDKYQIAGWTDNKGINHIAKLTTFFNEEEIYVVESKWEWASIYKINDNVFKAKDLK